MKRFAVAAVACVQAVALGALAAQAAPAQGGGLAENRQLTRSALEMLQQVGSARKALAASETSQALGDVNAALSDQTKLASAAKAEHVARILPLYTEFQQNAIVGAPTKMGSLVQSTLGVRTTIGSATFTGLDLMKSKAHLDAAKSALDAKDDAAAKQALDAIGDDLVVATVSTDLPLVTARENFAVAWDAASSHRGHEAATALADGARALGRYAREKTPHAAAATALAQTIRGYVATYRPDDPSAVVKIDGWWRTVDGWVRTGANA